VGRIDLEENVERVAEKEKKRKKTKRNQMISFHTKDLTD